MESVNVLSGPIRGCSEHSRSFLWLDRYISGAVVVLLSVPVPTTLQACLEKIRHSAKITRGLCFDNTIAYPWLWFGVVVVDAVSPADAFRCLWLLDRVRPLGRCIWWATTAHGR